MAFTLQEYVESTRLDSNRLVQTFEFPNGNDKMLEVNLGLPSSSGEMLSYVWMRYGASVAYRGEIGFQREGVLEHGFSNMFKKAFTGEGVTLVKATAKGRAQLYLADSGRVVTIFRLQGDSIVVNGEDLLAFEPSVEHKITMMKKVSSIASGGLFNVKLTGQGCVAILTHGKAITLTVGSGQPPVFTDAQATVAWSGNLEPDFHTDFQFKSLLGRGSGETFQMKFDASRGAQGFVLVQPFEEIPVPLNNNISN